MNNRLLLYFGHPAQFMMFRQTIKNLEDKKWKVKIVIKTKDVLETLVKESGFEYENILQRGRADNMMSIMFAVIKRDLKMFRIVNKFKPDIMIGTDPSIAHISWLKRIPGITIVEDDYDVIKKLVRITYPFTKIILCPEVCKVDKYKKKKIGYASYMKLGYLHPDTFEKDDEIINKYHFPKRFILIRLSALKAYHDHGIGGIDRFLLEKLISICKRNDYDVEISTEVELFPEFGKYKLNIEKKDIHHILCAASILISDSQSMSVEAAMLGTPSIRYSGFAGRISVLEELEKKYELTFGIPVGKEDTLFSKIQDLLDNENLYEEFQKRRAKMLSEKINLSPFLVWFIENFPQSSIIMKENPEFQYRFL
jgi:uncharacterized protein